MFKKPENVTKKDLAKSTVTKNGNHYNGYTLYNAGNGSWKFHRKTGNSACPKWLKNGDRKELCIQESFGYLATGEDEEDNKESDYGNDSITIFRVGYKEWYLMELSYSFVILMYYLLMLICVWLFIKRENIMRVLIVSYQQTKLPAIICNQRKPTKPPDPSEVMNDSHIPDLIKAKLNTGPVTYDILPHNLRIDILTGICVIFTHSMLLNILF